MKTARNALACAGLALLAACDSPVGTCTEEKIVATMPTTLTLRGIPQQADLSGQVSEDNVDPATFARLRRATGDAGSETGALVFTLQGPGGTTMSVAMRIPTADGRTLQVRSTFDGGGWGFTTLPADEDARVGVQVPGLTLRGVAGAIVVEDAAPLRLRMDLQATTSAGDPVTLRGTAVFANDDEEVPCS